MNVNKLMVFDFQIEHNFRIFQNEIQAKQFEMEGVVFKVFFFFFFNFFMIGFMV